MKIAFFGSSLLSAYWNGACTYYRGLIRALHERGHHVTFYEPDAFDRQKHRDLDDPAWADVVVYEPTPEAADACLQRAADAQVVVKASGVGVLDELLERRVLELATPTTVVVFWDVDAPATLSSIELDPDSHLRRWVPEYDAILTYGGGEPVVDRYLRLGARLCVPIYNALDPSTHHPVAPDARYDADVAFLGNRLPDREARVESFFFAAARRAPRQRFLLGGAGWQDHPLPDNVTYVGHVPPRDHNALNCSPLSILNVSRESMASNGFSPATRVFEAAGAGACLITDAWQGIELFLEPGREVLVASSGSEVAEIVQGLDRAEADRIGRAALERVLAEHTYAHRAAEVERVLSPLLDRASIPTQVR